MNQTENSSLVTPPRSLVLTGMMGAGKSSVGRKLAARLQLPFFDSDGEIEQAAGMTTAQFFQHYGEAEFRKGERRVIARLLDEPVHVLSTGGGAFMDDETRGLIKTKAISIWIKVPLDLLVQRATRRNTRPLLQGGDPHEIMERLLIQREPVYASADITITSDDGPVEDTVGRAIAALQQFDASRLKS